MRGLLHLQSTWCVTPTCSVDISCTRVLRVDDIVRELRRICDRSFETSELDVFAIDMLRVRFNSDRSVGCSGVFSPPFQMPVLTPFWMSRSIVSTASSTLSASGPVKPSCSATLRGRGGVVRGMCGRRW